MRGQLRDEVQLARAITTGGRSLRLHRADGGRPADGPGRGRGGAGPPSDGGVPVSAPTADGCRWRR